MHAQSHDGNYDISEFLLSRGPSPYIVDFFGHMEIKMIEESCDWGLYATREVSIGELFLVSNIVTITYEDNNWSAACQDQCGPLWKH